uniref:ATP synthase F0 subunit 8 n=1 Tax=Benthodytes marianensis TaxID=2502088 RepID=A0A3T0QAZ7_9ECHN|nr:ATP synthase F0 subunit 8 [Benthodytes marianensis]AZZ06730.1 ATP synthase F0 subunit 8 [Benthodytes marianensis]
MPQLELIWFIVNFFLAWSLIIFTFLCLISQNNSSSNDLSNTTSNEFFNLNNNWNW